MRARWWVSISPQTDGSSERQRSPFGWILSDRSSCSPGEAFGVRDRLPSNNHSGLSPKSCAWSALTISADPGSVRGSAPGNISTVLSLVLRNMQNICFMSKEINHVFFITRSRKIPFIVVCCLDCSLHPNYPTMEDQSLMEWSQLTNFLYPLIIQQYYGKPPFWIA